MRPKLCHAYSKFFKTPFSAGCKLRYYSHNTDGQKDSSLGDSKNLTLRMVGRELPILSIPLPSIGLCQFTLKPWSENVGMFCDRLHAEDSQILKAAIYTKLFAEGVYVAQTTAVWQLLKQGDFHLRINDTEYKVGLQREEQPEKGATHAGALDDLKGTISALYAALDLDAFKAEKEALLIKQLEELRARLQPLEEVRCKIDEECRQHSKRIIWTSFMLLGVEAGIFARLTWWEYSWDIMEPFTYFATFSTVLCSFGYYLLTNQNFEYSTAHHRIYSQQFVKRARAYKFDLETYNQLVNRIEELEEDLRRMRDPFFYRFPLKSHSNGEKNIVQAGT